MKLKAIIITALSTLACLVPAHGDPPPIEAYGALPTIRSMAISPDGSKLAYIRHDKDGTEAMIVRELGKDVMGGVNTSKTKASFVTFYDNEHVILGASKTTRILGFRGKIEYNSSFAYNIKKRKLTQLLSQMPSLYPGQSGLGRIVGSSIKAGTVFMPGFVGSPGQNPRYSLIRANLKNGHAREFKRGTRHTIDWIATPEGEILVREDYDEKDRKYTLYTEKGGKRAKIYEHKADLIPIDVVGVTPDGSGILAYTDGPNGYDVIRKLDFEGNWSAPLFQRENIEVESALSGKNREVFGVRFSGLQPSYAFFDQDLQRDIDKLTADFSGSSVSIESWSDGFRHIIAKISGSDAPDVYVLFNRETKSIGRIVSGRPDIPPESVGDVLTIEYQARDGLTIPSILTLPPGRDAENLPLIAMPHGGPEAYDQVGFDWMAQYFASRGYAVLQPNFRGSDGFGDAFTLAGRGKWGQEMQDDVTDGVEALINGGYVDPERVCIVGASYGGYAALAGGAYTPELYKCVAAIAPVSDLPEMLRAENRDHGYDSWVVRYWEKVIGDRRDDREKLKTISPARSADTFSAPVLLIHGKDDTVVPMRQSNIMARALKKAGKDVEIVRLDKADHWLLDSDTRLETLKALSAFVDEHIGSSFKNTSLAASPPAP